MSVVFVISAPSGSGKSTLVRRVLDTDPKLTFSISYTTRAPRGAEKNGQNYHYTDRNSFEEMISRQEFLEHAEVFGNYYGTHRSYLDRAEDEGLDLMLDIDVQGAAQLKKKIPDAVSIFVLAPSRVELEKRLRSRSEDTQEVIERRLREAAEEIRHYDQYDYVLVNREVEKSVERLKSIIAAERMRRNRMEREIRPILESFRSISAQAAKPSNE
ncbi:MAG: guanylate kinase [Acidobacteriota bacterium]